MGFFKFLIITIIILYIVRIVLRMLFPVLLKKAFSGAQQRAEQQRARKPEGTVSVDYVPQPERKGNADNLGEFVDFEEVKDK